MPAVYLVHRGLTVYRVYRNDNVEEGEREHWFTLDPHEGSDECNHGDQGVFDVRRLPPCPDGSDDPKDIIRHAIDVNYDDWMLRYAASQRRRARG
jgi:hypothetical protein